MRTSLVLITLMGAVMLFIGAGFYLLADQVATFTRFLLPLPPIFVAAYIYVLNKVNAPEALIGARPTTVDLLEETAIGTLAFLSISGLLLIGFGVLPDVLSRDSVRTNFLLITLMGGAMLIVGAALYAMADRVAPYGRFLLPLPPISVGSYIYVLNEVSLPDPPVGPAGIIDLLTETLVAGTAFFVIAALLLWAFSISTSGTGDSRVSTTN